MRISDWSSDVCSSDLEQAPAERRHVAFIHAAAPFDEDEILRSQRTGERCAVAAAGVGDQYFANALRVPWQQCGQAFGVVAFVEDVAADDKRSEERRGGKGGGVYVRIWVCAG